MSLNRKKHSATGTRTRVARVRAEYPNQLDYSGCCINLDHGPLQQLYGYEQMPALGKDVCTPLLTFRPTPIPTLCHWAFNKDTDGSPVYIYIYIYICTYVYIRTHNALSFWTDVYLLSPWHPIAVLHMLSKRTCFSQSKISITRICWARIQNA